MAKTAPPFAAQIGDDVSLGLSGTMHVFDPGGARIATVAGSTDAVHAPQVSGRPA